MIDVARARQLLPDGGRSLSDAGIERLLRDLYALAEVAVEGLPRATDPRAKAEDRQR